MYQLSPLDFNPSNQWGAAISKASGLVSKLHWRPSPHFGTNGGGTDDTFKAEMPYVTTDANGRVGRVLTDAGARKGRQIDTPCCIVFQVKAGRMASGTEHFFTQQV